MTTNPIDEVLKLQGADRKAKAYAVLYAAFKKSDASANPVRDAVDCIVPFIAPYTQQHVTEQVTPSQLKDYLKATFGFDLPVYSIELLMASLQKQGFLAFNRNQRAYIAQANQLHSFDIAKAELETHFDEIILELGDYAKSIGFNASPVDGWGAALIEFLKSNPNRHRSPTTVKGAILDRGAVDEGVVANFIGHLKAEKSDQFSKLLKIFMGVLIEEFLTTLAEVGEVTNLKKVTIFYDTGLLLRQLGSSGKVLKIANQELTEYLQALGFSIRYFSGNESEVYNILDTIIQVKDSGGELEGETATALADREIDMAQLRDLQNALPERLARYNIFPAGEIEKSALDNARNSIDERGLATHLKDRMAEQGRGYSHVNSRNDAGYVGTVMRLRGGRSGRDLADCQWLFVTPNRFLAVQARRFLIQDRQLNASHVPPVLAAGQLATIAWLLRDNRLDPENAGKELLANCYAAVNPDAQWFKHFKEGLIRATEVADDGQPIIHPLTLQAARRIAHEDSLGNSSIMKNLNMAEIIGRAEEETSRLLELHELEKQTLLNEKEEQARQEMERAVVSAVAEAEARMTSAARRRSNELAMWRADTVINFLRGFIITFAFVTSVAGTWVQVTEGVKQPWFLPFLLFNLFLSALGALDLFGKDGRIVSNLRLRLARRFGHQ